MCSMLALPRWDCSYSQTFSRTQQGSRKPIQDARFEKTPQLHCNIDVSRQPRVRWFWPLFRPPVRTQRCISPVPIDKGRRKRYVILSPSQNSLVLSNHDSHKPRASREHLKQLPASSLQPPTSSGSSIAISEVPGCRI
ncbi:hypothetical protein BDV11DRAFT_207285 [Aspergillus similis]